MKNAIYKKIVFRSAKTKGCTIDIDSINIQ